MINFHGDPTKAAVWADAMGQYDKTTRRPSVSRISDIDDCGKEGLDLPKLPWFTKAVGSSFIRGGFYMRIFLVTGTRMFLFLFLLLGLRGDLLFAQSRHGRGEFLFVYWGTVIAVDPASLSVQEVGFLSPTASTVTADADGLLWGRLDPNYLAAWSPTERRIVARVPLRHKVYNHVLVKNGKAYVTHNALTDEGFSVSVIDTEQKKLIHEIKGIGGLRTDLLESGGFVYLAARGVRQQDYLHLYLYRIDAEVDRLEEIYRYSQAGYYWLMAASPQSLFICYLATAKSGLEDMIEVMDLDTLRIVRRIDSTFWGSDRRLVHLFQASGRALLLCRDVAGSGILIETDPELTAVHRTFPLGSQAHRILGVQESVVMYFDSPLGASPKGVTLHFYDTGAGKEVKRIDLPRLAEARRE